MPVMAADSDRLSETMLDAQAEAKPASPGQKQIDPAASKIAGDTGKTAAPLANKPRRRGRRKGVGADRTGV